MTDDTRAVRDGEELDWPRLEAWLHDRLHVLRALGVELSGPMRVAQFPGGHSNLTYRLQWGSPRDPRAASDAGTTELVMRRAPLGPVAPTAHDMAREFRWLSALHPVFPLAPRAYLLCDDPTVAGSVFYVMERRRGIVVRHDEPPQVRGNVTRRRAIGEALVDALADLHRIDVVSTELAGLGKPAGFVGRQVRGWTERWQRSQTTNLRAIDELAAWLARSLPPDPAQPGVVHGDFKLDNVMLDATRPEEIVAVLDWEMSALGDPLVDVGILLAYWLPSSPAGQHDALTTVTNRPGWPTRDALVERYQSRTGRDLSAIAYFEAFALFKIAVVIQQIFQRYQAGQTSDARFAAFGERVTHLAQRATELVERIG
jgi:aminoglycoside phosphotransferase (APT) family kinase protein